jgi:hypothetical protein
VYARVIAELAASGVLSGFTRHAVGSQFFFLLFAVKAHFFLQVGVELFAAGEEAKFAEEAGDSVHGELLCFCSSTLMRPGGRG